MTEEIETALSILKRAMRIEQDGHEFYLKAARTTRDEKGQEIFRTLADDEQNHFRLIQQQYTALTNENKWVSSAGIKPAPIELTGPLFPGGREALEKKITARSGDLDALLFGLEIEDKSYDLYRTAASSTTDPLGKDVFAFLAGQEKDHFNILMMRYEYLAGPIGWSV